MRIKMKYIIEVFFVCLSCICNSQKTPLNRVPAAFSTPNKKNGHALVPGKAVPAKSPLFDMVSEDTTDDIPAMISEMKTDQKATGSKAKQVGGTNKKETGTKLNKSNMAAESASMLQGKKKGDLGLKSGKRYDIAVPEVDNKNDETMVVIDEEGDDEPREDIPKEATEDPAGYMIVLDNSISRKSNQNINNKSLKELSRGFSSMNYRLDTILRNEKKRQEARLVDNDEMKKARLKFGNARVNNVKASKKDDFVTIEDAKLLELQQKLKEEGTDDEFIKLVKESESKNDRKFLHSKNSTSIDDDNINKNDSYNNNSSSNNNISINNNSHTYNNNNNDYDNIRDTNNVVKETRKELDNKSDPLDRFDQVKVSLHPKEASKSTNINSIQQRKLGLPLANPHPTISSYVKSRLLTAFRNLDDVVTEDKSAAPALAVRMAQKAAPRSENEIHQLGDKKTAVLKERVDINTRETTGKPAELIAEKIKPTLPMTVSQNANATNNTVISIGNRTFSRKNAGMLTMLATPTVGPSQVLLPDQPHIRDESKLNFSSRPKGLIHLNRLRTTAKVVIKTDMRPTEDDDDDIVERPGPQIIDPWKAQTMLEYINKDPLELWIYDYRNLKMLGLNSTMLRNGLVNAGSIDRIKSAMKRALKGEDITLSIVGGSISAGGGLYKDRGNIDGLYYKGLVDWWNKAITPLTGSTMLINNVAIGSIGTDYFSYCVKNHILNDTDLVLWELSGNDYNRYVTLPTKGAKPLERLTRMILQLPKQPALMYINFFKGIDYKVSKTTCPNFEDQGEDIIAHYYKLPSLSWRSMVCEPLLQHQQLFTLRTLFSNDQYHPSLRAHAQMALLLILHLRHVMRSVLQWAADHSGTIPDFADNYMIPPPLFVGLEHPKPLCWTLITPDLKERITNSLHVTVLKEDGFKLDYATNFPVRYDRVICWKADKNNGEVQFQFEIPIKNPLSSRESKKYEVAITTHSRWFGSAEVWLDERPESPPVIEEGRKGDTGRRTQVDVIARDVDPGVHKLTIHAKSIGFCLSALMIN